MKKCASLLDYSYPGLPIDVWQADGTLLSYHKDFILKLLNSFYLSYGLEKPEQWVTDITVIGSLTTNKFIRSSDFDCHIVVNIKEFIETNMPGATPQEAMDSLDTIRYEFDRAKMLMPLGDRVLEFFIESPDITPTGKLPSNKEHGGIYSIITNTWLKEPVFFEQGLDYEESKKQAIEEAKELAGQFDASFGEIRRSIQRVEELVAVVGAWPVDKQKLYYDKLKKKLVGIENEIEEDIALKQKLVNGRQETTDRLSDNEIQFKFLGRFHYFNIVNELGWVLEQAGGELSVEELPLIEKVLNQAEQNNKFFKFGSFLKNAKKESKEIEMDICVDFDKTIAQEDKYPNIGEPVEGAKESLAKLKEMGYHVIIYSCRGDTKEGSELIKAWLDKYEMPYDSIFEGNKPFAKFYIDDRAIEFKGNWAEVLEEIES